MLSTFMMLRIKFLSGLFARLVSHLRFTRLVMKNDTKKDVKRDCKGSSLKLHNLK